MYAPETLLLAKGSTKAIRVQQAVCHRQLLLLSSFKRLEIKEGEVTYRGNDRVKI